MAAPAIVPTRRVTETADNWPMVPKKRRTPSATTGNPAIAARLRRQVSRFFIVMSAAAKATVAAKILQRMKRAWPITPAYSDA